MKKRYYLFAIAISMFALQAKAQTQGDITLAQTPNFMHDQNSCVSMGQMYYTITIANSFLGDSVKVIDVYNQTLVDTASNYTGQNPWVISFNVQGGYYLPDQLMNNIPGPVILQGPMTKIINVHSNTSLDTMYNINNDITGFVNDPCLYGDVSGQVYIDYNSNCIFDGTDAPLQSIGVAGSANLASPSSSPIASTSGYTNSNGNYNMAVQQTFMTNYSVKIPSNYQFIFPSTFCSPVMYTDSVLPQTNFDFSLQCTSNIDVQCYANSAGVVRPNQPFYMYPYVSNTGCLSASGMLKLVLDSRVNYNAGLSSNPATTISGDTLIWNYTNLTNLSGGGYWNSFFAGVHLTPNLTVNIGDTLCFRVMANVPTNDVDAANNDYTICLPVVNSYDPNVKEVYPLGQGLNGNIPVTTGGLIYTVHFQNTGNAVAYNVSIIDTLDSDIIPSSLQIMGSTHNVTPEWLAPGIVKFNFFNINLPDSTSNEAASHGSVRFSVKLNPGLPAGTQIKNKAEIYFDFNTAIVTNTTINTLVSPLGMDHLTGTLAAIKVYPNPFSDNTTFMIQSDRANEIYSFEMFDVLGKNVKTLKGISTKEFQISRNGLENGVYFYKIYSAENTLGIGKLIVQ
jgi:uncharacterized repeat protein (TIGR01451 family)